MPITKIIIENFKGIRDRVEIPIRPLALLFGANSAGKTTVLHSLLYLRELLERQNADADRVIGGGKDIYLGGFRQLVHGHDESKTVTVGVEFSVDEDGLEAYPIFRPPKSWVDTDETPDPVWEHGVSGVTKTTVEIDVAISQVTGRPIVACYRIAINGERMGEINGDRGLQAVLTDINTSHSIFDAQYSPDAFDPESQNPITTALETTFEGSNYLGPKAITPGWIAVGASVIPKWGQALDIEIEDELEEADAIQAPFTKFILSQLMVRPGELVLEHLRSYRHLGPIRAIPDLSSISQRSPSADRWIDGTAAWDLLGADAESQDSNRGQLLEKVDSYLKDENRLNLCYSLGAETVRDIPVDSPIAKILERFITAPDEFENESTLRAAYAEALTRRSRSQLQLTDLRRNTSVNPSDIGAGVSQVIPVLVSVLDTGSKITAIEQPELHLHPAVQCSLGDLFVRETNKKDERFFLIETHSEHLLLRLMKRIRETQSDSNVAPDLALRAEAIAILFVETYEGRSVYREMPLNERGELVKAWPGGFFEEDLQELI
jgi:predicted ATPase